MIRFPIFSIRQSPAWSQILSLIYGGSQRGGLLLLAAGTPVLLHWVLGREAQDHPARKKWGLPAVAVSTTQHLRTSWCSQWEATGWGSQTGGLQRRWAGPEGVLSGPGSEAEKGARFGPTVVLVPGVSQVTRARSLVSWGWVLKVGLWGVWSALVSRTTRTPVLPHTVAVTFPDRALGLPGLARIDSFRWALWTLCHSPTPTGLMPRLASIDMET